MSFVFTKIYIKSLVMKKIFNGLIIFLLCTRVAQANFGADISLQQDSLNPYKFTATIRVLNYPVFDFEKDSVMVSWDNVQKKVPLYDTLLEPFNRSTRIYKDTYTFAQYESGIKVVGFYAYNRPTNIINIDNGQSENVPFYAEAGLNLDILKSTQGAKSLVFGTPLYVYDTVGKTFFHPSEITRYDSDSFTVDLVRPYQSPASFVPVYQFPHENSFLQNDTSYVDPAGNYFWDTTTTSGIYCIALRATEFRNGELMFFAMRDMLLYLFQKPTSFRNDFFLIHSIEIFPNPTNATLTIQTDVAWQEATATLTNPEGRVVMTQALNNSQQQTIDIGHLAAGIYFVTVQSAQQKWVRRVVKAE
jgi:hypothetical protein